MWVLSEVREKVCDFQKLPLDKSHFITEVGIMKQYKGYYIDGMHFKNKEQIDEFIKANAVESYKTACRLF